MLHDNWKCIPHVRFHKSLTQLEAFASRWSAYNYPPRCEDGEEDAIDE